MVKVKYYALYTDDFGCDQAEVYLLKDGLELKVRNYVFKNDDFDFDFVSSNDEVKNIFYLKENELVEYFIDVKIPLMLTYKGIECIIECLLRIERDKNYYKNSLSLNLNGNSYVACGYDLKELLKKMKNKLPKDYDLEDNFSCMFEAYYFEINKDKVFYNLDNDEEVNEKLYSYLSNIEEKNNFERLQKIPINYISSEYYSS